MCGLLNLPGGRIPAPNHMCVQLAESSPPHLPPPLEHPNCKIISAGNYSVRGTQPLPQCMRTCCAKKALGWALDFPWTSNPASTPRSAAPTSPALPAFCSLATRRQLVAAASPGAAPGPSHPAAALSIHRHDPAPGQACPRLGLQEVNKRVQARHSVYWTLTRRCRPGGWRCSWAGLQLCLLHF